MSFATSKIARLRVLLRLAGATLTIFVTTGTIAIAVSGQLAIVSAIIVFTVAFLLVLIMIPIDGHAHRWHEGPDVDRLMENFHHGGRPGLRNFSSFSSWRHAVTTSTIPVRSCEFASS